MRRMAERHNDPEDWDKLKRTEVECPNCKNHIPMYYNKIQDRYLSLGLYCRSCDTPYTELFAYVRLN